MEMSDFNWQHQKYAMPEIYVVTYVDTPMHSSLRSGAIVFNTERRTKTKVTWNSRSQK